MKTDDKGCQLCDDTGSIRSPWLYSPAPHHWTEPFYVRSCPACPSGVRADLDAIRKHEEMLTR